MKDNKKKRDLAALPIAFLEDLAVTQNGEYVKTDQTLDENLRALDSAIQSGGDVSGKADKVQNATEGNFAGLDSNGNLTDSGKKASDFATAEHSHAQLKNGASTLDMGVNSATISVPGPDVVNYVLDITGGTMSGRKPSYVGGDFEFTVPGGEVEIPVTLHTGDSTSWYSGSVTIDGITYEVKGNTGAASYDSSIPAGDLLIYQGTYPNIWGLQCWYTGCGEGEDPELGGGVVEDGAPIAIGGTTITFNGKVNDITRVITNPDVTKTLATTDDIPTADNTTIENNNGTLSVKDGGITSAKLAPAVSSAISSSLKESDLDNTTIEKDATNGVQVKDGAITTAKLANLASFNLIDSETGDVYMVRIANGRMEIVGLAPDEPDEPYTPTDYPLCISMQQVSDGNGAGAASPRDFVTYTWKLDQPNEYGAPESIEKTAGSPILQASVDGNNVSLNAMDDDYNDLGWRILYPCDFSTDPELECDEGASISADMFELSWVDPEEAGPFDGNASAPAPKGKIQKRQ